MQHPILAAELLGEGHPLLEVGLRQRDRSQMKQGDPERIVGFHKQGRVPEALGQSQGLFPILPRPLEVPPGIVYLPESMQYADEVGGVPWGVVTFER